MANLFTVGRDGTSIASAATITPPEDGDRFDVTGTTGITTINQGNRSTGARIFLAFDDVVTVTYNASTLILQGSANFTSAAGDILGLERISGGWQEFSRWRKSGATSGALNLGARSELTISSDAVTKTGSFHSIDTEADAAGDNLETINGGSDGDVLFLVAENATRTVTVKHNTGNIVLSTGADSTLSTSKIHHAVYDGATSKWIMSIP